MQCQRQHIGRFSNLHLCTFKIKVIKNNTKALMRTLQFNTIQSWESHRYIFKRSINKCTKELLFHVIEISMLLLLSKENFQKKQNSQTLLKQNPYLLHSFPLFLKNYNSPSFSTMSLRTYFLSSYLIKF